MKKWHKTCCWLFFGIVAALLILKFAGVAWITNAALPPLVKVTDSSCRPCAHNEAGQLDAGYKITATLHNYGGSGYATVKAKLYKSNGLLWIQKKKKIWLDGGTTDKVEFLINKEVTLFGTQPEGWDVVVK